MMCDKTEPIVTLSGKKKNSQNGFHLEVDDKC